eukprot:SAG31_NODE_42840_length_269_cov_2.735294_1_plen_32_part_01
MAFATDIELVWLQQPSSSAPPLPVHTGCAPPP